MLKVSSISGSGALSWQNILNIRDELKASREKNEAESAEESSANANGREAAQSKPPALPADKQYIPGTLAEQLAETTLSVLEGESDSYGEDAENKIDLGGSGLSKAMFDSMDTNQDGVVSAVELAEGLENQRAAANSGQGENEQSESADNGQNSNSGASSGQANANGGSTGQSVEETTRNVASGRGLSVYMGMGGAYANNASAVWQGSSSEQRISVRA